jgi:L-ribulose-5-phosphate 4-epimerase
VAPVPSPALWRWLCERGSVTTVDVAYGTPEMAREVMRLFRAGDIRQTRIFAMAGHRDGIVAFGSDLRQVLNTLTRARNRA